MEILTGPLIAAHKPQLIQNRNQSFPAVPSVQFSRSVTSDSLQPHGLQHAGLVLSITSSQSLLKLMSVGSVMPSNHLILCCPLLLLTSIFPRVRVFSNESVLCIRWPMYWSTEEGNGKPCQCSCLENPMNSMRRLFHTSSGIFSLPSQKKPGCFTRYYSPHMFPAQSLEVDFSQGALVPPSREGAIEAKIWIPCIASAIAVSLLPGTLRGQS